MGSSERRLVKSLYTVLELIAVAVAFAFAAAWFWLRSEQALAPDITVDTLAALNLGWKYRVSESSGRIVRRYLRGGARSHHIIDPSRVMLNDDWAWVPARRCSKSLGRLPSPRAM